MSALYPNGTNWRCGVARITYRPDWDPKEPFIAYLNGTAKRHFPTLREAQVYLSGKEWKQS